MTTFTEAFSANTKQIGVATVLGALGSGVLMWLDQGGTAKYQKREIYTRAALIGACTGTLYTLIKQNQQMRYAQGSNNSWATLGAATAGIAGVMAGVYKEFKRGSLGTIPDTNTIITYGLVGATAGMFVGTLKEQSKLLQ